MKPINQSIPEPYVLDSTDDVEVASLPSAAATLREAAASPGGLYGWAERSEDADALVGRGVTYSVPAPDGEDRWVVRHYRRGGFVARFNEDRYLDTGVRRPLRELRASVAARERGIDTPEVIGFAFYPAGVWYRADIVTRYVPDSRDLADILFGADRAAPEVRLRAMTAAGAALGRAHARGLVHNDLNAKNILLSDMEQDQPRAWVLDLDRATVARDHVAKFERDSMLRRFSRSLKKWEKSRGLPLDAGEREAFAGAYARGGLG